MPEVVLLQASARSLPLRATPCHCRDPMPLTRLDTTAIACWLLRLPLREAAPTTDPVVPPEPVPAQKADTDPTDAAWFRAVRDYQAALCDLVANVPGACETARVRADELAALDGRCRIGSASGPHDKDRT